MIPMLLFGCENWMLTDSMLHQLESFQGEIGRRILKVSLYTFYSFGSQMALSNRSITGREASRHTPLMLTAFVKLNI